MKQRPVMILMWLILLLSLPLIPAFSADLPDGWRALRDDLHINEKTVTRLDGATVSAWLYLFPHRGSDVFQAAEQQLKGMRKNSSDLEYIGYLSEIDCRMSRYRSITTIFFRDDSNIIASRHRSRADWRNIEDKSIYYDMYQSVCNEEKTAAMF
ncbi:MAG: hypothetical protein HZB31_08055 [Nitrospirae bacterium]|nr:hypothetical protein [Nitrospirota bacterium]